MRTGSLIGKAQLAAFAVLAAHPAAAQERSAAYRSYVEARAVLDRGIVAVGGLEALRGIQTIAVDFEGEGLPGTRARVRSLPTTGTRAGEASCSTDPATLPVSSLSSSSAATIRCAI